MGYGKQKIRELCPKISTVKTTPVRAVALFFCTIFAFTLTAQGPWEGLQKIAGTWKRVGKSGFEKWMSTTPDTLAGEAYTLALNGEKKVLEYMRIVRQTDGAIVFQAMVPDQNDGATISFPLTFFTTTAWTFENQEHDFPKTIDYWLQDDETLRATVAGDGPTILFQFNRIQDEQAKIPATLEGYDLFVSNRSTGTIERYDAFTGKAKGGFGKAEIGGDPQDLLLGPDGMLYVVGLQTRHVLKFNPATGAFLGPFSSGFDLRSPVKLGFGPDGFLYVGQLGDDGQGSVVRFDGATGRFDRDVTGPLAGPTGLTWDKKGNLYVACKKSREIRKFPSGGGQSVLVSPPGILKGPSDLWFASNGDLLVADLDHVAIKRFRPQGGTFAYEAPFADGFGWLEGVALGPDGFLYACDSRLHLLKKLDADSGESIGVYLEGGGLQLPNGLAFWKQAP